MRDRSTDCSQESADELFEHAPCGYLSTLPDGAIVQVNQTFLALDRLRPRELLLGGRASATCSPSPGRIFHETHFGPLLQMQGFVQRGRVRPASAPTARALPVLVNAVRSATPRRASRC